MKKTLPPKTLEVSNQDRTAIDVRADFAWLSAVIDALMKAYFQTDAAAPDPATIAPPVLRPGGSRYADILHRHKVQRAERLLLVLALVPHLCPQLLDIFFHKNQNTDRGFTEFGGVKGVNHSGFIPTGETALFLLGAHDVEGRVRLAELFQPEHYLYHEGILRFQPPAPDEPLWSAPLHPEPNFLRHLLTGEEQKPDYSAIFPAKRITTLMRWSDLVLDAHTLAEVNEIKLWAVHHHTLMQDWELGRILKPGYKSLFYGAPGTGKTLTACLLGIEIGAETYRIDLSEVVSKYIGETAKNLANIFNQAEKKNWILFFDEADALFGKRTQASSAHDRFANQEVSYLLQRMEDFSGIIILATNMKNNMDDAFARRFQSMIYFPLPTPEQRRLLWKSAFSRKTKLARDIDLDLIASEHEVSGGQIVNVVRHASLAAAESGTPVIRLKDILAGIQRERKKEGRLP